MVNLADTVALPCDSVQGYAWIQYQFKKPQTIKALCVVDGNVRSEWACDTAAITKHLEVSDDGKTFHRICDIPHGGASRQTIDIPETTARYFRVIFDNPVVTDMYADLYGIKAPKSTKVAELVLYPVAKINHAEEKAGFASPHDMMSNMTPDESNITRASDVVDLTSMVDAVRPSHMAGTRRQMAHLSVRLFAHGKEKSSRIARSHRTGGGQARRRCHESLSGTLHRYVQGCHGRTRGQARTAISAHRQL
jgi:hypothetical protein